MELRINLADREEIAAAVPLLQLILDGTLPKAPSVAAASVASFVTRTQVPEGEEFYPVPLPGAGVHFPTLAETQQIAQRVTGIDAALGATVVPGVLLPEVPQPFATEGMSHAAVFGGAPVADPLPSSTAAPVVPAPIVPTIPTPGLASSAAPVPPGAFECDIHGLPWDSRIHASTKAKLQDGSWKVKRGVAPEMVKEIEAQLRPAVPVTPGAVPVVPAPFVPPPAVPVVPSASADPTTFEQMMPRVSAAVVAGIMAPTAIGATCAANGLHSVVQLQTQPDFIPLVWATLKQQYPALV